MFVVVLQHTGYEMAFMSEDNVLAGFVPLLGLSKEPVFVHGAVDKVSGEYSRRTSLAHIL